MAKNGKSERIPPHWRIVDRPTLKVQFQWELRDLWVGLFWRKTQIALHLYVCIVPCVPLHVTILRKQQPANSPRRGWSRKERRQGFPDWFQEVYEEAGLL